MNDLNIRYEIYCKSCSWTNTDAFCEPSQTELVARATACEHKHNTYHDQFTLIHVIREYLDIEV